MNLIAKLVAISRLTRIEHSIMLAVAVVAAELITGAGRLPPSVILVLSMLAPIFASMSAFAINDYLDIEADRANKKPRPLVTKELKPVTALYTTGITAIAALALSAFINIECFAITLLFSTVSLLYSYGLKRLPLVGNAYVALAMAIPFLFGNYATSPQLSPAIVVVFSMAFMSGLAREIHGTIRDYNGDVKARHANTLPVAIGKPASALLALFLYIAAIAASAWLYISFAPFSGNAAYALLIGICDLAFAYVGIGFVMVPKQKFYDSTRNVSLGAMALAILAILMASL